MTIELAENRYGKSAVRLVTVARGADRHDLADLTVEIVFRGDYEAAYRDGDNSAVYPTDSMKNSVYALARDGVAPIDRFALRLAEPYLSRPTPPESVEVTVRERPWSRIEVEGRPHRHAFVAGGGERRVARVTARPGEARHAAGIDDLTVLKTTGSAFAGFPRDRYTTLAETDDRIFATAVEALWRYAAPPERPDVVFAAARRLLLESFAEHESRSVQHTLHAMGESVLESIPEIDEIRLRMPNKHHWRVDLEPFGLDNPNLVYVATAAPYGLIEGTLRRA